MRVLSRRGSATECVSRGALTNETPRKILDTILLPEQNAEGRKVDENASALLIHSGESLYHSFLHFLTNAAMKT